jgi:hypothetical protein
VKVGPPGLLLVPWMRRYVDGVSRTEILLWIVALFWLEVNHLKWIWWENWRCRACTVTHKDCSCGRTNRWIMYL